MCCSQLPKLLPLTNLKGVELFYRAGAKVIRKEAVIVLSRKFSEETQPNHETSQITCGLFNDVISKSYYVASNGRTINES
jgi:hypothetical protein